MNKAELRRRETAIWDRLFGSVLAGHYTQILLKLLATIGGGVFVGIGGALNGSLAIDHVLTPRGWLVVVGVLVGALGSVLLILSDRERPGLVADVRRDLAALRNYVDLHGQMTERESWRIDCDNALRVMLEAVENALLDSAGSVEHNLQNVLAVALHPVLDALGVCDGEDYTVSIFCRDNAAGVMRRVAEQWYDEIDAEIDQREWAKSQGFTGQAWASRATLSVPDALAPHASPFYGTPPTKTYGVGNADGVRPDDERYRAFACVPIMVGADKEPWGILTVTSDAVGRFDAVGTRTRGADNVPLLKLAAALIALVAAAGS